MNNMKKFISFFLFLFVFCRNRAFSTHCTTTSSTKTYKKCMTLPTQQASIAYTFHPQNATFEIVFFGTFISPSGWVGWGINPNAPQMTGTRALIAFPDPNSGKLILLPYVLDPDVKLQKTSLLSRPVDERLVFSSAVLYGGKLATIHDGASVQIHATIKLEPNRTKLHVVWNRGLYVQGYSPTIHPTTTTDLASIATVDVTSSSSSASTKVSDHRRDVYTLRTVHAVVNTLAWGVLLPIGAVTARYLRQVQSVGPTWFYVHAGIQLVAIFLGSVGFGIGLQLGKLSIGVEYALHRKIGIGAFSLGILQTLALFFRPKTTNKFRKYWKSYHHFVGYGCVVLGIVNVFQGFEVMGDSGSYGKLGFCLCLSTLIGVCVALEVNSWVVFCRKSKEEKMRREGLIGGGGGGGGSDKESEGHM